MQGIVSLSTRSSCNELIEFIRRKKLYFLSHRLWRFYENYS